MSGSKAISLMLPLQKANKLGLNASSVQNAIKSVAGLLQESAENGLEPLVRKPESRVVKRTKVQRQLKSMIDKSRNNQAQYRLAKIVLKLQKRITVQDLEELNNFIKLADQKQIAVLQKRLECISSRICYQLNKEEQEFSRDVLEKGEEVVNKILDITNSRTNTILL